MVIEWRRCPSRRNKLRNGHLKSKTFKNKRVQKELSWDVNLGRGEGGEGWPGVWLTSGRSKTTSWRGWGYVA